MTGFDREEEEDGGCSPLLSWRMARRVAQPGVESSWKPVARSWVVEVVQRRESSDCFEGEREGRVVSISVSLRCRRKERGG